MESTSESRVVGNAFVQQYYILMHKDPGQLHRFYLEQSSFVHGGAELGSEKAVVGQKAIHDKIMSLGLNQVHTRIKQVESLSTLGGGIVIQVTGDLSVGGKPSRAFVQTFVLAPTSPKVYYVHNSIFRYQDDDLVSESEADEGCHGATEHPVTSDTARDEYTPSGGDSTPEDRDKTTATEYEHVMKEAEQERPEQETTTWESFGEVEGTEPLQNGQPGEEDDVVGTPPPQDYSSLEPAAAIEVIAEERSAAPPTTAEPREVEEVGQKQPKSWASCVSKNTGSTGTKPPSSSSSTSVSTSTKPSQPVPLPQRESKVRRPPPTDASSRGPPPQATAPPTPAAPSVAAAPPAEAPPKKPAAAATIADSFQVFVGGLPGSTTERDLKPVFEKFGNVVDVRVNPKNFAFVIFDSEDAARAVITCKEPFYLNTKRLNIEPKKERAALARGGGGGGGGSYSSGPRRQGPPMGGGGGARRDREQRDKAGQKPVTAGGGNGSGGGKRFPSSH